MRVVQCMIAFGLGVGCLNYAGRAEVPCDPAGSKVNALGACTQDVITRCGNKATGVFGLGVECDRVIAITGIRTNDFNCVAAQPNPATPAVFGTACVDWILSGGTPVEATCTDITYCELVQVVITHMVNIPGVGPTVVHVERYNECRGGRTGATERVYKITVPCVHLQ